ncbi:MAG: hypothetical protein JNJ78_16145 [Anaerolineae bacterium]|nr:hypothetical protein [Anaerolineae bacterium]
MPLKRQALIVNAGTSPDKRWTGFCSSGGGGGAVKCGGKQPMMPPRGVFVVVVVVAADKEGGGSERERRRQAQNITPSRSLLPFGEGEMAGLAALAAVSLAL